jgi:glycosyltransferase involved in cell wall biosynthesis
MGGRDLCLDVTAWLKQKWDAVVVCGYAYPTVVLAMAYMRLHRIHFYMEVDGGLIRESSGPRYWLKRILVSQASGWISSGKHTTEYLVHYGAKRERVVEYPFTSLWEADILKAIPTAAWKQQLREALGMEEEKIALYVGRFLPEKGMDDLLEAVPALDRNIGIYFVGGEPTQAHLAFCREHNLSNVHFEGFKKKEVLLDYYKAADLLVLPTKSDVWGLVINEAMAYGLPIITTDRCVAGLELVRDGINGYLIPKDDQAALDEKIRMVFASDYRKMGEAALETIRPYTIENMAKAHLEIFT